MKMTPKSGQYLVLIAVAFVLVMFGSRFVTLRFGQVFPETAAQDTKRIANLEAKNADLEAQNAKLSKYVEDLATIVERIDQKVDAAKNAPPKVVYQRVEVPTKVQPPSSLPAFRVDKAVASAELKPKRSKESGVVHRGDSAEQVRQVFGRPVSVQRIGSQENWNYDSNGFGLKRVVFVDGQVSEWQNMPVEP